MVPFSPWTYIYFLNLCEILRPLVSIKRMLGRKKIWTNDEAVTGSKKNFFVVAIFCTFERHATHLRSTFVENVTKSQKLTHPLLFVYPPKWYN
jgi:hypothetical protein